MSGGTFTISLDFELNWGVRDKKTIDSYKENLLGVRKAIPAMLELFKKHEIHATWATVGFLHFAEKKELIQGIPNRMPAYSRTELSPYQQIDNLGANENEDPFHYGASLVRLIRSYSFQEIGTHTFSHYYCMEDGQNIEAFASDLKAVASVMQDKYGKTAKSIVFPRNQTCPEYISCCLQHGILTYRGNPIHWIYAARQDRRELAIRRLLRLFDAYFSLTGHHTYKQSEISGSRPFNILASRYLRPYCKALGVLEPLKLHRVKSDLTYAAKNNSIYHLWWHPHDFGQNLEEKIAGLQSILAHYSELKNKYSFNSLNMGELGDKLDLEVGEPKWIK